MKKILFAFFLALLQVCAFAQTPFTAPWGFNYSAPTGAPSALGTRVRFDITTGRIYTWSPDALNWQLQGYTIDQISGTSAPAYAPVRGQSWFAVNGDTLPRLYQYTGSGTTWKCLNCSDGKTYTAGTGITLSGPNLTVINNAGDLSNTNELNTGFDISGGNLRIIDAGATRTVAVTSIAPDQSVTNEIQTIDTFLVSGSNLLLSLTQDNQPAKTITLPASGITALTGDVTASGPGSAAATIANGAVTGAKLAANSVDSTKITPLSIANSDIANVAPEKLLQKGASTGQVLGWNGSIWGPTAAGITGSGVSGQVGYFSGTSTMAGNADFTYNNTQKLILLTNSTFSSADRGIRVQQSTNDGASALITFQKSRSGLVTSGTGLGTFDAQGFDGSAYRGSSRISFIAGGTPSAGIVPGQINFSTANTSGVLTSRTTIDENGLLSNAGSASIGLATNAARLHVVGAGATSATWTAQFHNSTGTNNALMVRDDGFVGIGSAGSTAQKVVIANTQSLTSGAGTGAMGVYNSIGGTDIANNNGYGNVFDNSINIGAGASSNRTITGNYFSTYAINSGNPWTGGTLLGSNFATNYDKSTGTMANVVSALFSSGATRVGGTVTNAIGVRSYIISNGVGTTVTDGRAIEVLDAVGGGTVTTSHGIYINSLTAGATNYAIYTAGTTQSYFGGKITFNPTNTSTGTTGAQTINRPSGTVNFAGGATSLVVTNSLVTTSSLVFATVRTNDATATIKNVVPGAGSFTITLTAAATAETSVGFFVIN